MKITVCDECKEEIDIFKTVKGKDFCDNCYHESEYYLPSEMEDSFGYETGHKLNKCQTACHWGWKANGEDIGKKLQDALKDFAIEVIAINTDDGFVVGFNKFKSK